MKINKLGQINDANEFSGIIPPNISQMLTSLEYPKHCKTTLVSMSIPIILGEKHNAKEIKINIPFSSELLITQKMEPVSIFHGEFFKKQSKSYIGIFAFKNQFFVLESKSTNSSSIEEATLLVKKQVYSENKNLAHLRQEVTAMEKIINGKAYKREAIPDGVKMFVFERDEGRCVKCASDEKLHFDHIIPVSKGGGNSDGNIQILCEKCNLRKSDKIAF